MKVAQNDEANPDTQSVRPPHLPNLSNSQLSPSAPSVRKRKTLGILSRMLPPSPVPPTVALGHTSHCSLTCHASSCLCLHCIYCFFPLFSPVDYETDTAAAQFDYGVDDPSYLPEQPGKPPPPLITRYRLLFSILLALE